MLTSLITDLELLHQHRCPSVRQAAIALHAQELGLPARVLTTLWQRWQYTQLEFGGGDA